MLYFAHLIINAISDIAEIFEKTGLRRMRRQDREVIGQENILAILDSCDVLRLGLCADDKPYIVPMNFAYELADGKIFIYLHCAREGRKIDIIRKNNNACFEADIGFKTLEKELACEWSALFQSVYGEGKISEIADDALKARALDIIMKRYGFEGTPVYKPESLSAVNVLCIDVELITGKQKLV